MWQCMGCLRSPSANISDFQAQDTSIDSLSKWFALVAVSVIRQCSFDGSHHNGVLVLLCDSARESSVQSDATRDEREGTYLPELP